MNGAAFALVVNIAVAGLFASTFAIVALANPGRRSVLWFSASYAIGMLTPLSEFMVPISAAPSLYVVLSYASFMAGLLAMSAALAVFFGRAPPWLAIGTLFAGAMSLRWLIWGGQRDTLPYELAYQLPFAAAVALSGWVVFRSGRRRPLDIALMAMFGMLTAHFLTKPLLAVAFGSGGTARDYVSSTYALLSQAASGILLIATGLLALLIVVQTVIADSQAISETDPLSGLLNRRGFDLRAGRSLERARRFELPLSVAIFDIDHFKQINDRYGHDVGDEVIRDFAILLKSVTPSEMAVARFGGEEFVALLEPSTADSARLYAEAVRAAAAGRVAEPLFTVSAGVAALVPGESVRDVVRRADQALYEAKRSGRDRVCVAGHPSDGPRNGNGLRRA